MRLTDDLIGLRSYIIVGNLVHPKRFHQCLVVFLGSLCSNGEDDRGAHGLGIIGVDRTGDVIQVIANLIRDPQCLAELAQYIGDILIRALIAGAHAQGYFEGRGRFLAKDFQYLS